MLRLKSFAKVFGIVLALACGPQVVLAQSEQVLDYSTLLGSKLDEQGRWIATDASGYSYVLGSGRLSTFPTTRDPYVNGYDLFVAKFDPAGSGPAGLVWSTILGGEGFERPGGIALDTAGNIYLVGTTKDTKQREFPTTDGTTLIGTESIFMFKLNNEGYVQYSTILAEGVADDREQPDIAVGEGGYVFVTGRAMNGGNEDALVAKFSQTGDPTSPLEVEYNIFLGGSSLDLGAAIEVDRSGNAYITGRTTSTDFPTTDDAYQTSLQGASDVFVAKIDGSGALDYSTYFGGDESNAEMGVAIAVDSLGRAHVTGRTNSLDFPLKNGLGLAPSGQNQAFLAVIDPVLAGNDSLIYSTTWLGGSFARGTAVAVDASGWAYVVGTTLASDMPTTPDALFQSDFGRHDGFLTVVDPSQSGNSSLVSSTYFGSSRDEWIQGIDLHEVGGDVKAHVTGHTGAREGFPVTPGAYQEAPIKSSEVFFSVLAWQQGTGNSPPTVVISSPEDGWTSGSGATITFAGTASDAEDGDLAASLVWTSSIDGEIGLGGSFSTTTLSDGSHTITASVTDSGGTIGSDSISITVGTPPAEATTVSVTSIAYATEGGKNQDRHLLATVALVDDLGNPVAGASVSIDLFRDGSPADSGSGTTGTDGTVTFASKNARAGAYTTTVTNVTAAGLDWDGVTPPNSFIK